MLTSARDPLPDLGGRYRIERVLSDRDRSLSLVVREPASGLLRFLKVGGPATATDPLAFRAFRHEPAILKRLERDAGLGSAPHVLDEGVVAGRPFFVLEMMDGYNLAERLRSRMPLDGSSALRVITRVLEVLQAVHLAGVAHGDISPENIQIRTNVPFDPTGPIPGDAEVALVDFETSRRFDGAENREGMPIAGRPSYLAPEILRGKPLSPRSDLFAVGVVFYQLLTGEIPYADDCLLDPEHPPSFEPSPIPLDLEVPFVIEDLARRLIEPDPGRRVASAAEALRELRHIDELRRWLEAAPKSVPDAPAAPGPAEPRSFDFEMLAVHDPGDDFAPVSFDDIPIPPAISTGLTDDSEVPAVAEPEPEPTPVPVDTPVAPEPEPVPAPPVPAAIEPPAPLPPAPAGSIHDLDDDPLDSPAETSLPSYDAFRIEDHLGDRPPSIDETGFTVLRPALMTPGLWMPFVAWVHRLGVEPEPGDDEIDPDLIGSGSDSGVGIVSRDFGLVPDPGASGLPAPGCLTLIPHLPGVEFEPERQDITWDSAEQRVVFRARAGVSLCGRAARGFLSVYWGGILIGEVRMAVLVDLDRLRPTAFAPGVRDREGTFRRIFASYSPRDVEVRDRVEMLAARIHDGYMRECLAIRGGDGWEERLRQVIDRSEVFQLFWSSHSMDLPLVRSEYEYALKCHRSLFVRPCYWEEPFPKSDAPPLPPERLRAVRFEKLSTGRPILAEPARPDARPLWLRGTDEGNASHPTFEPSKGLEGSLAGYEIAGPLGSGTSGTIHHGRHIKTGLRVVIKRSNGREVDPPLYREALRIVGARQPGIVPVVDAFEQASVSYVIREFHEGRGLADLIKADRPGAVRSAELVAGLAERIHAIHKVGRIHRDLKPSNILIDDHGQPRLWADHLVSYPDGPFLEYLQARGFYGTPAYMAPERMTDSALRQEPRSDVYALGVILYELLTGRCPFVAKDRNINTLLIRIVTEAPPAPSSIASGLPSALDDICHRCLEKSPDDRYSHAMAVADDLNAFVSLETDSDARG